MTTLSVPSVDIIDRPDKTFRSISWYIGWDGMPKDAAKINNARLRMQTTYVPNCHGLGRMGYIERFGEKHPEYFALRPNGTRSNSLSERMGGQLCFSSGIVEEIYQDAKAYLRGVSATDRGVYIDRYKKCVWDWNAAYNGYFNVMPQDGMLKCQCEKCKAQREKNPDWDSEFVWQMTADFANRLKAEGVKGQVTQMAYGYLVRIPDCDIPPEVPVQLAIMGSWGEAMEGGFTKQIKQLDDWNKKLNHKVYLWTYECKYSGRNIPKVPCSTPLAVSHFYKAISHGTFGGFMESEADKAVFQALNWYIFSRMMWDESIDGEKEFNALCNDFFGKGAPAMKQFFATLENLWLEKICANCVMTETGPKQTAPSQRDLWTKIYSPATLDRLAALIDAAKEAAKDAEAVARIAFWEREYLACLRKSADDFHSIQQAKNLLDTYVPEGSPIIDGSVSDAVWQNAPTLHLQPLEGKELQVRSYAKLLRDNDFLYIAMRCEEPQMADRHVMHLEHDDNEIWATDSVEIFLAPDTMPGQYVQFMINTKDSLADLLATPAKKKHDYSYESSAELKSFEGEDFYSIELKIPLSSLGNPSRIAADFAHSRMLDNNPSVTRYHTWSPFVSGYGDMENFGTLLFEPTSPIGFLKNGDFSMPQNGRFFGPWATDAKSVADGAIALDDRHFISGGKSIRLTNDGTKNLCIVEYLKDIIEPDTNYRLTCFLKIKPTEGAPQNGGAFFMFNDGVNHAIPNSGSIKTEMPWTRFSFDFKSRGEISDAPYLRLYSLNFNGVIWADCITLEKLK